MTKHPRGRDPRQDDDADLRVAFAAIREEDAAGVPAFEAVLAGASRGRTERRRPWLLPTLTGTVAAAALAVAGIAVMRRPEPRLPKVAVIEQWTAPTDFLLETPGREFLETVPSIGDLRPVGASEAVDEGGRSRKRRSVSP